MLDNNDRHPPSNHKNHFTFSWSHTRTTI